MTGSPDLTHLRAVAPLPERIETERFVLRRWCDLDREAFASLNADPIVMEHFPAPLDRAASDAMIDRIETGFEELGWGLWAVAEDDAPAMGFVGCAAATFPAPFNPSIEVGWRLARTAWGRGVATECAIAATADVFARTTVAEITSFTAVTNVASQRVMQRIGMVRDPAEDFDHPNVAVGDPLRPHVLYRLARPS